MKLYSEAAMERAMKIQEVILRAMAKRITWWQAAEILGISDRQMRRWKRRYELWGSDGLYDRRRGKPSPRTAISCIAEVDGTWTMKYFRKRGNKVVLVPGNKKYKPITPRQELRVAAVVKAVIRKY